MFEIERKYDLILFTLVIDLYLLVILYSQNLNSYDLYLGYVIFISHIMFIINLQNNNEKMIDILHVWYMLYTGILGIFITNKHLVMFYLITMSYMLYFWYYDSKCPLGRFETLPSVKEFTASNDEQHLFVYGTTFMLFLHFNKLFKFFDMDPLYYFIFNHPEENKEGLKNDIETIETIETVEIVENV